MNLKNILKLIVILITLFGCSQEPNYDILILNGEIYDGSGNDPITMDIAIKDSLIVKIGDLSSFKAKRIIDANGLAVAPGFIDMHAHLDPILELSECESHIRQGVTTALGGPDGSSPWPLAKYMDTLNQIGIGMNVASVMTTIFFVTILLLLRLPATLSTLFSSLTFFSSTSGVAARIDEQLMASNSKKYFIILT